MNYGQVWPGKDTFSRRCCRQMSRSQTVSVIFWELSSSQRPSPSQGAADGSRRQAGALTCQGQCPRWWRGSFLKGTLEARGHWVVVGRPKRPCNAGAAAWPSLPSSLCFGSWNKWACQRRCLQWPCVQAGVGLIMRLASCWAWVGLLEICEYQCGYLWKRNTIPFDIWLALKGVCGFKKGRYDMEFKLWSSLHGSPVRASDSVIYNWRRKQIIVSLISNLIFQNFKMNY